MNEGSLQLGVTTFLVAFVVGAVGMFAAEYLGWVVVAPVVAVLGLIWGVLSEKLLTYI